MNFLEIAGVLYLISLGWDLAQIMYYAFLTVHYSRYKWSEIKKAFSEIPEDIKRELMKK